MNKEVFGGGGCGRGGGGFCGGGGGERKTIMAGWERLRRCLRTVFFMLAMLASLLVQCLPLLVAIGDVLVPCVLVSSFTCVRCYGFKQHLRRYAFKSSLVDIPLVSVLRSLLITCTLSFSLFD